MAGRARRTTPLSALGLSEGDAVIVYLQAPKEKVWGLLLSLQAAGIVLRCIDLAAFDDWMRQEARGDEPYLGLTTLFYPMGRVERLEKDETLGPISSYSARFAKEVGRSVHRFSGSNPSANDPPPGSRPARLRLGWTEMAKELYGLKILVVDDDKDTLELLEWVLKRAGAEVTAVSSAKAAMEALERDRPTILVSDIAMPEEDGLGLMRRIRALPKERGGRIPAVALTAHSMVQDRLQSLRAGFQSHVPKPVVPGSWWRSSPASCTCGRRRKTKAGVRR